MPIHFYDSATPQNVPSGVYAAVYVNGFAWPERQVKRMARVFRISVHREAFWAKYARCIDVESGAALPEDVPGFLRERRAHGYGDGTVYVNRSNWETVKEHIQRAALPQPFYWVATLDGTQDVPGAWAVQYRDEGNRFDLSVLHGINNFVRP